MPPRVTNIPGEYFRQKSIIFKFRACYRSLDSRLGGQQVPPRTDETLRCVQIKIFCFFLQRKLILEPPKHTYVRKDSWSQFGQKSNVGDFHMVKAGFGGAAPKNGVWGRSPHEKGGVGAKPPRKTGGWGRGGAPHYKQSNIQAQPFNIQFNERFMTVTRARFRSHIPCDTSYTYYTCEIYRQFLDSWAEPFFLKIGTIFASNQSRGKTPDQKHFDEFWLIALKWL